MRQLFVILIFFFLSKNLIAQVGIGNTNPNAQLDVRSSNQATPAATDGILIPKVDTFPIGVNANQDTMLVYLTTTVGADAPGFYYYNHATIDWIPFTGVERINDLFDGKSDVDGTNDGSSIFIGIDAGANDDASNNRNVGIGLFSLNANTSGSSNVAIGVSSLERNTSGFFNIGIGTNSLSHNLAGNGNIGLGYNSLSENTVGGSNIAIGSENLKFNQIGSSNIAIGYQTLRDNTSNHNIAIGYQASLLNTSAENNIAIGTASLRDNLTGERNIALGYLALVNNEVDDNVAIGHSALYGNSTGTYNTALGSYAGFVNTTGRENTAIGYAALHDIATGNFNTAVGSLSMRNADAAVNNVAIGVEALRWTAAAGNVAVGNSSLMNNIAGDDNTAIGNQALESNTTGSFNTAVGWLSLYQNGSGDDNTALGQGAMRDNNDGNGNVSVGYWSLYLNTSGDNNVAVGKFAGNGNAGSSNVFLGYSAGIAETGSNKLYIANSGVDANNALIYGEFDTKFLRFNSFTEINGRTVINNTTDASGTIGTGALEVGNGLRIDGNEIITNTGTVLFLQSDNESDLEVDGGTLRVDSSANRIGISNINPQTKLHIEGGSDASLAGGGFLTMGAVTATNMHMDNNEIMVRNNGLPAPLYLQNEGGDVYVGGSVVHSSDFRLKTDFESLPYGLKEVLQLQPKQYYWKNKVEQRYKSIGLIAQEAQQVIPEIIHESDDEQQTLNISYTELIPVLINAIKEQQKSIETLKNENTKLSTRLNNLENTLVNSKHN